MKLSDVMSGANLAVYAEVGLVLFLLVFFGVVVRVLWPRAGAYEEERMIPLRDESTSVQTLTSHTEIGK